MAEQSIVSTKVGYEEEEDDEESAEESSTPRKVSQKGHNIQL